LPAPPTTRYMEPVALTGDLYEGLNLERRAATQDLEARAASKVRVSGPSFPP